jgi:2-polyprenyl-6-hydroxyphenyl methylase/3-demethylubiquinone-9 3-methyltransferase
VAADPENLSIPALFVRRHPERDRTSAVPRLSAATRTEDRDMPSAHATRNIAVCLWFDGQAENAANFYARTFPDSHVDAVHRAPGDYPEGKQGDVLTVEFTVLGMPFLGLNGGPQFKFDEAVSFQVYTSDQAETDRLWNAIVDNGGAESECGWCKDRFGLSWQITPRALMDAFTDPDRAAAKRAFDAMMTMRKIDIAKIEAARRG